MGLIPVGRDRLVPTTSPEGCSMDEKNWDVLTLDEVAEYLRIPR